MRTGEVLLKQKVEVLPEVWRRGEGKRFSAYL